MTMSEAGRILLDDEVIRYRSEVYGDWDLPLSNVRIIGEATNQSGPFADDYFLCFATGASMWHEVSYYAEGRDKFLLALGAKLGKSLEVGLFHSVDFTSRVLWPSSLAGEPMFQFDDIPVKGFMGKFIGPLKNRQTYSDRVAAVLAGNG